MSNNYDAATNLRAYFESRTSREIARHHTMEAELHDWAAMGAVEFFEGPGDDPTVLSDYATNKLWLRVSAGVTASPGTIRYYNGGTASLLASWPVLNRGAFAIQIGARGGDLDYLWSAATSGDPGSGKALANHATLTSATALHISKTGRLGQAYASILSTWSSGSQMALYELGSQTSLLHATLSGALSDQTAYFVAPITVNHGTALTPNMLIGVDYTVLQFGANNPQWGGNAYT
jgi:hypothetical protein